jgi:hypothetical protein
MRKHCEVLRRRAYVAPWLDATTQRRTAGCCVHYMSLELGETEGDALARAQALLDLLEEVRI